MLIIYTVWFLSFFADEPDPRYTTYNFASSLEIYFERKYCFSLNVNQFPKLLYVFWFTPLQYENEKDDSRNLTGFTLYIPNKHQLTFSLQGDILCSGMRMNCI